MFTDDQPAGASANPGDGSGSVLTVTGPVPADSLGPTLPHEHLVSDFSPPDDDTVAGWERVGLRKPIAANVSRVYEAPLTMELLGDVLLGAPSRDNWRLDEEATTLLELGHFAERGGDTVVDLTSRGLGRDPAALRRLSESAGLRVVMGAGWYGPARGLPDLDAGELADEIVREIEHGVDGVRAGVIGEVGPLDPSAADDRRLLDAVAAAALRTGAPIVLDRHEDGDVLDAALAILLDAGLAPERIAVGHCDALALRPDALERLVARGVHLSFDLLGDIPTILTEVDDHDVAVAILALAERGRAERVLVSQNVHRKMDLKAFGGSGYVFLAEQFDPYLHGLGADDALVRTLMIENPRRFLTLADPSPAAR